ncbi:MAG: GvpL/GvpF family gas vesicle protein [Thermodesulfobacteriota bacterium]
MRRALYVFCLTKDGLAHSLAGPGLEEGHPLRLHGLGGLAAVACPVSLADFSGAEAEARLRDTAWLLPRLCRHEEVVERAMSLSPVLPLRFGTIFSSPEALARRVRPHQGAIAEFLAKAAGREEWAVKGYWNKAQALERLCQEKRQLEAGRLAALGPGQRYFEEKKLAAAAQEELGRRLRRSCEATGQALARQAAEFLPRNLLSADSGGDGHEMVVNWAFWVPRGKLEDFQALLRREQAANSAQGLLWECSGPWPPYSFAPCLEDREA